MSTSTRPLIILGAIDLELSARLRARKERREQRIAAIKQQVKTCALFLWAILKQLGYIAALFLSPILLLVVVIRAFIKAARVWEEQV